MHKKLRNLTLCLCLSIGAAAFAEEALVLQTDFGLKDGVRFQR